jgi:hypothetical protein
VEEPELEEEELEEDEPEDQLTAVAVCANSPLWR